MFIKRLYCEHEKNQWFTLEPTPGTKLPQVRKTRHQYSYILSDFSVFPISSSSSNDFSTLGVLVSDQL